MYVALTPVHAFNLKREVLWTGVFFGICASLGQAGSTVLSRKANVVAQFSGLHVDGGTAALPADARRNCFDGNRDGGGEDVSPAQWRGRR